MLLFLVDGFWLWEEYCQHRWENFVYYFYIYTPDCVYFNYITNSMIPYAILDILHLSPFLLLLNSLFSVPLYFK